MPDVPGTFAAAVVLMERVRAYCETDCLNLFALYIRWALLSGRTNREGHDVSLQSLVECLERDRGTRAHLDKFLDCWRASDRPAPMFLSAIAGVNARRDKNRAIRSTMHP